MCYRHVFVTDACYTSVVCVTGVWGVLQVHGVCKLVCDLYCRCMVSVCYRYVVCVAGVWSLCMCVLQVCVTVCVCCRHVVCVTVVCVAGV